MSRGIMSVLLLVAVLWAAEGSAKADSTARPDLISPTDISYGEWETIGSNDHGVLCLAWYDGMLFAGGAFTEIYGINGYITANGLAAWDGSTWRAVGWPYNPSSYPVRALVVHDGELFASAADHVARWTGESWEMLGTAFGGGNPYNGVCAMTTYDGQLVAAGDFRTYGETTVNCIARWDGVTWLPLGEGADASVKALTVYDGELVAGGQFNRIGGQDIQAIAAWDGSAWHALGSASPRLEPYALGVFGGYLIGMGWEEGFAKWDGVSWTTLGNTQSASPSLLTVFDSFLMAGFSINTSGGLWRWESGTTWNRLAVGSFRPIYATVANGNSLYVAGSDWCGDGPCYNIVRRWTVALWAPQLADIPGDEGGFLRVGWLPHALDSASAGVPITSYDVQRREGSAWVTLTSLTASQADSYSVEVSTPDILTPGDVAPTSDYRIVAKTADPLMYFESAPTAGYSIDNLPPPVPVYLASFTAERLGSEALVRWSISQPVTGAGFHLWRQEPGHERIRVSEALLSGQTAYDFTDPTPPAGPADYWLQEVETDGSANWYGPSHLAAAAVPTALRLYSAAPNPFNPTTTIRFDLPAAGPVRLSVYDVAGRLVRVLVEGEIPAGSHEAVWDGRDASGRSAPSGGYLARLVAGGKVVGVRLSLVR
jgi:hypothetical protein